MAKRKDTNKENEPDPADEDEEGLPSQKRAKRQVFDGVFLQTTGKLTLGTCSQKHIPLWARRTHTIRPLGKPVRLRGIW